MTKQASSACSLVAFSGSDSPDRLICNNKLFDLSFCQTKRDFNLIADMFFGNTLFPLLQCFTTADNRYHATIENCVGLLLISSSVSAKYSLLSE